MKILFFGTPEFAVPSLQEILRSRHKLVGVVTQLDRPKGRSNQPAPPPVKEVASQSNLPVFQPDQLQDPSLLEKLRSLHPDCGVVVAYGKLMPLSLLKLFPKGAINLHASLLPKYRGAAPIQWVLIRGEEETGVTIFQLDGKLDHGPILLQEKYRIDQKDDAVTLSEALSQLGAETLVKTLDLLESSSLKPIPQNDSLATDAPRLKKEDGIINWKASCQEIHNRVRGLQPWPGALTWLEGKLLKILSTTPDLNRTGPSAPGAVVGASSREGLWIQTGKGQIRIDRLQLEGGKELDAPSYLLGHPLLPGTSLGAYV